MSQTFNAAVSVVSIDIGKNSFHIVGHDKRGAIVLRQKDRRPGRALVNHGRSDAAMPSCIAPFSREANRKRLSQPVPDRISL
jgi:hypothetical protein